MLKINQNNRIIKPLSLFITAIIAKIKNKYIFFFLLAYNAADAKNISKIGRVFTKIVLKYKSDVKKKKLYTLCQFEKFYQ